MKHLHEILNLTRPLVGIDLETSGVDPKTSGICELALEIFAPGVAPREYRTLVNPLLVIPESASAIHGITNAMVQDAPTFRQLADDLEISLTDCDFVGYNPRFDLRQTLEEFLRAGKTWSYEGARILCGYRLWQIAEGRKLEDAVRRWINVPGLTQLHADGTNDEIDGQAHNALYDVRWSTRVVAAQLSSGLLPTVDIDELHQLQWPGWYDAGGKLRWNEQGVLCISFGAHKDKPLHQVPKSYLLGFICAKDFEPKVKEAARHASKGLPLTRPGYPIAPAAEASGTADVDPPVF